MNVGKQATLMATAAVAAFTATVGAAWHFARGIAEAGDAAFKAGQRTGTNVEIMQELAYAAELSDLSIDSLQRGMGRLSDMAGKNDEMFKKLGIRLKGNDGKLRDTGDYLKDLADIFAALPDGTMKTALATKVFGDRLGRELIPFLNEGRAGLEKLGKEARDLGIILPENLAKASVDWNDNVSRLLFALEGVKTQIIGPLIPLFNDLTNEMRAFIAANKAEVVTTLSDALKTMIGVIPDVIDGIRTAGGVFGTLLSGARGIVDALGGFQNVAIALAAVLSGKLIVAVYGLGVALATTPVGWFLSAITAIAVAAKLIYDNWDGIVDFFTGLWNHVKNTSDGAIGFLKALFQWTPLGVVVAYWEPISAFFEKLFDGIKLVAAGAWQRLKVILSWTPLGILIENWGEILAFLGKVWGAIAHGFSVVWGKVAAGVKALSERIGPWMDTFVEAFYAGPKPLIEAGIKMMQALWDGIVKKFGEILDWVADIPARIRDAIVSIDLSNIISWPSLPSWLGGGGQTSTAAALGRIAGSTSVPQNDNAPAGLLAPGRQEAKVGGEITIKVEGPGAVTSVKNANTNVPLKPVRGASAALD